MTLTPLVIAKLALVPAVVWLASLAARRWGHAVSGYLGGFPMIGGPITLYLAIDFGPAFAAQVATATLAAVAGQAGHLLGFAYVGRAWGPLAGLACGLGAYVAIALIVAPMGTAPFVALALAAAGLALAWRLLPRPRGAVSLPAIPPVELWLRLVAALTLAAVILFGAESFGPVMSGVLLSLPITGAIMPPFTLALYGRDALAWLQRGFITGLTGFASFFFVLAMTVEPWGIALSFLAATACAVSAVSIYSRLARPRN
jgi:hypothetical protein